MADGKPIRADHTGPHEKTFRKNRDRLLKTGGVCGICGQPVDVTIKDPRDPMAPVIDHIIPIAKGGHPSDISNLQLAHRWCNRQKADKLFMHTMPTFTEKAKVRNDDLPLHFDWRNYKAK